MKDFLESLAVILIILVFLLGPILAICAVVGKIPLSILNPFFPKLERKFKDHRLKGGRRVLVGVIGVILWGAVWTSSYFVLCSAFPGLPTCNVKPTPADTGIAASATITSMPVTPAPTPTPTPTHTLTPPPLADTPLPTDTPAPTPMACVCQSASDDDTIRCLIRVEAEAANQDDLALIQQIFAPDATIFRGDTGEEWENPIAYYGPSFASLDFTEANHFDVRQVEITSNLARYTSGSSGYYAPSGATPTPYYQENPSDHWVFGRNEQGCWVIARFEFNASHLEFP